MLYRQQGIEFNLTIFFKELPYELDCDSSELYNKLQNKQISIDALINSPLCIKSVGATHYSEEMSIIPTHILNRLEARSRKLEDVEVSIRALFPSCSDGTIVNWSGKD